MYDERLVSIPMIGWDGDNNSERMQIENMLTRSFTHPSSFQLLVGAWCGFQIFKRNLGCQSISSLTHAGPVEWKSRPAWWLPNDSSTGFCARRSTHLHHAAACTRWRRCPPTLSSRRISAQTQQGNSLARCQAGPQVGTKGSAASGSFIQPIALCRSSLGDRRRLFVVHRPASPPATWTGSVVLLSCWCLAQPATLAHPRAALGRPGLRCTRIYIYLCCPTQANDGGRLVAGPQVIQLTSGPQPTV